MSQKLPLLKVSQGVFDSLAGQAIMINGQRFKVLTIKLPTVADSAPASEPANQPAKASKTPARQQGKPRRKTKR